jgi:hypothetical protein
MLNLLKCFDPQVPFPDKMRIVMAFFDILDAAFVVLKDSSNIDWQFSNFDLLIAFLGEFSTPVAHREGCPFRAAVASVQLCNALLACSVSMRSPSSRTP